MQGAPADLPPEAASWTEEERSRARRVLGGEPVVVNVRKNGPHRHLVPWLLPHDLLTYVGRAGRWHDWPNSDFGNPFVREVKVDREGAIRHYEQWLDERPELLRRLAEGELTGRALGCWCAPLPCHADVLAARIEELSGAGH